MFGFYLCNNFFTSSATGAREYFSTTLLSGLPKWLINTTLWAPLSKQWRTLGKAATILRKIENRQNDCCNLFSFIYPLFYTCQYYKCRTSLINIWPLQGVYKQKPNWNTCWKLFSNNKLLLSYRNKLQEEKRCTPLIWAFVRCFIVHYIPFAFAIPERFNIENWDFSNF